MKKNLCLSAAILVSLSACGGEANAPEETAEVEQGGQASGDLEGGTINDAMIPLEALQSTSPTVRRQTTVTTSSDGEGGTPTTVETTAIVTSASSSALNEPPAPAPPDPPAPPRG
ncbi:MAG: hypothetical protein AAF249_17315 [Pseudomonadota bacterium]